MVEVAFGRLAAKWRLFHRPLELSLETLDNVVKACCILHNLGIDLEGKNALFEVESEDAIPPLPPPIEPIARTRNRNVGSASVDARNAFVTYFQSQEGRLPWQDDYINRLK